VNTQTANLFVVLGMHRSGTSALARALRVLGVELGTRLMPGDGGNNDRGFFEDLDVKRLNEELLAALGLQWDSLLPIDVLAPEEPSLTRYRRRAAGLLRAKTAGLERFGLKDPRLCQLLPFWNSVFERIAARPAFVIAYRNPLSVARSLALRDGFVAAKSHFLWVQHMFSCLAHTSHGRRIVVDFDKLVDTPAIALNRIAQGLGLDFNPQSPEFARYNTEFLERELRHARHSIEEAGRDAGLPRPVLALAALLHDLATDDCTFESERFGETMRSLEAWLASMRPTLELMSACDARAVQLASTLRERNSRIDQLETLIIDQRGGSARTDEASTRAMLRIEEDPVAHAFVPKLSASPLDSTRARLTRFFLPQFHAIPENDEWWGTGCTQWVNVKSALPQFAGHQQPNVAGDLGYYDLLDPGTLRRQTELARLYGVEGFCFYFYWFGGKRLLEAPLENYLQDQALELPFCLCWANENWTRRWDGMDHEILIEQRHSTEDDLAFIANVARYLRDPRYLKVDGKPLLLVYRPGLLPAAQDTARRWRDWCRDNGIGEIFLAYTQSFDREPPAAFGFDAAIEFPPDYASQPDLTVRVPGIKDTFRGIIHDWRIPVERSRSYARPDYTLFRGVGPAWDNTPRRGGEAKIYCNSSTLGYQRWLANAVADTRKRFGEPDRRLIFINAWNEWAEGAYLEPDARRGYARLEATRMALVRQGLAAAAPATLPGQSLAIVLHAYHLEVFESMLRYLAGWRQVPFRLYVTTEPARAPPVRDLLHASGVPGEVFEYPNRGRDVLPFLHILPLLRLRGHDVILKAHTKKSEHRADGELWSDELFASLLSESAARQALAQFDAEPALGIIGARGHVIPMTHYWGRNAKTVKWLSARLGVDAAELTPLPFVAGTMFYCRVRAMVPLLNIALREDDFEVESGQIDGTMAHALERVFTVSALAASLRVASAGDKPEPEGLYRFAAPTRLPPELEDALLEKTDALVERLRVTDAAMARAESLAMERLDEIEALNERIDATDRALQEAQTLALTRLDENRALLRQVVATQTAQRDAEQLAVRRLAELEDLEHRLDAALARDGVEPRERVEALREGLAATETALHEAERMAIERLSQIEASDRALRSMEHLAIERLAALEDMRSRMEATEAGSREAQRLALVRLEETEALRRRVVLTEAAFADAQGMALARLDEIESLRRQIATTETALAHAQLLALTRLDEIETTQRQVEGSGAALGDARVLAIEGLKEEQTEGRRAGAHP